MWSATGMDLEEEFGLALDDIKNYVSPTSYSYLTSVVLLGGCDEENSQRTIGERSSSNNSSGGSSTNWSDSSGKISTILSDKSGEIKTSGGDDSGRSITCTKRTSESGSGGTGDHSFAPSGCDDRHADASSDDHRESGRMMTKTGKNVLTVTVPFVDVVENEDERAAEQNAVMVKPKRHLKLSSLQKPVGTTLAKDDALCSHLYPVCRKILAKTVLQSKSTRMGERTLRNTNDDGDSGSSDCKRSARSVSEIAEKGKTTVAPDNSPYELLIGKIVEVPIGRVGQVSPVPIPAVARQRPIIRKDVAQMVSNTNSGSNYKKKADKEVVDLKRESSESKKKNFKGTRTTAGVCDFSHPITNPLYKVYNPKGYVKSEDELAREYIGKIEQEFNGWLASLQGDPVQLDPQLLTKILRDELQLPGPHYH